MRHFLSLLFIVLVLTGTIKAQNDSLVFKNGNYLTGEIKSLHRGIFTIETDYSDSDFKIEWEKIEEIYSETYLLITTTDGTRYNGFIESISPGIVAIISDDSQTVEVNTLDIVLLEGIDQGFWSQVYASVDLGFDLTRANNFKQFSMRSNLGYIAKRWQLDASYSNLFTMQDETDDIRRIDGGLTYKYFLPRDWYPLASINFLSNTDQQLNLRTTGKFGMGKYVIHTNQSYWGFSAGVNNNRENFSIDTIPVRDSWEGFAGTELNLFDSGDLSLVTSLIAYPSFTESGRWRADYKFDATYDLPMDFYIRFGFTLNYDNQPAPGSPETDYVLHTGFGWEW